MKLNHAINTFRLGVIVVVIATESYDVLVGGVVLYPMDFQMDYWTETTTYQPSWQYGDGRMSQVPLRFTFGVRLKRSPLEVLASVVGFSGVAIWPGDLLEGNILTINILVYDDI